MGSRSRTIFLSSLNYPKASSFAVEDGRSFRELVLWLEDTKIRFYSVDDRKPLRASGAEWTAAFFKYAEDLECHIPSTSENRTKILDFLISQAITEEYRDNCTRISEATQKLPSSNAAVGKVGAAEAEVSKLAPVCPVFSQLDSPEFEGALKAAAVALHVPLEADVPRLLKSVLGAAQRVLSPAALEAATGKTASQAGGSSTIGGLPKSKFPLGFSLDDPPLDEAATLLRVLYINDLRRLQTQVDHYIVDMQEYTADPKTDAKLGRVGV
ncbi:hypothetical protein CYMTET_16980 [Cymbomonas tetramitiformis]|uniref:Uncharacterized protein n=1 Tax=Cymbomonas tetramitiformis TaxID=36881 RepID=A0AAE0GB27_9CHLO|nr:hypothetical protein CYMTET_16980 [Cymbomonas tetramitiformis]